MTFLKNESISSWKDEQICLFKLSEFSYLIFFFFLFIFYILNGTFCIVFVDMGLYPYLKSEERIFYANGVGSFLTLKISHGNVCYCCCCCIGIEGKMSSEREKNWINFFMSSYYKAARYSKKGLILVKGKRKLLSFEWHQCKKRALIKFIIVGE